MAKGGRGGKRATNSNKPTLDDVKKAIDKLGEGEKVTIGDLTIQNYGSFYDVNDVDFDTRKQLLEYLQESNRVTGNKTLRNKQPTYADLFAEKYTEPDYKGKTDIKFEKQIQVSKTITPNKKGSLTDYKISQIGDALRGVNHSYVEDYTSTEKRHVKAITAQGFKVTARAQDGNRVIYRIDRADKAFEKAGRLVRPTEKSKLALNIRDYNGNTVKTYKIK